MIGKVSSSSLTRPVAAGFNASRPMLQTPEVKWRDLGLIKVRQDASPSDEYLRKVQAGVASMPVVAQEALKQNGWTIRLAQTLVDAAPFLKGVKPRGGDAWHTAENRSGVAIEPNIYMGEKVWIAPTGPKSVLAKSKVFRAVVPVEPPVTSEKGKLGVNIAPDRTARHEMGHGMDALLRRPSRSQDFGMVYLKDFDALDEENRQAMRYFIQPDSSGKPSLGGKSEAMAEAFASLYGGGCAHAQDFRRYFPGVTQFARDTIQKWEARNGKLPSAWENGPPGKSL